jgi:hypothetical protein
LCLFLASELEVVIMKKLRQTIVAEYLATQDTAVTGEDPLESLLILVWNQQMARSTRDKDGCLEYAGEARQAALSCEP